MLAGMLSGEDSTEDVEWCVLKRLKAQAQDEIVRVQVLAHPLTSPVTLSESLDFLGLCFSICLMGIAILATSKSY